GQAVEVFQDAVPVGGAAAELGGDQIAVPLAQRENAAGGFRGLLADLVNALEEKVEPALPVALVANDLEKVVIILAMAFEEVGEVEHGFGQDLLLAQEESDEQAPHTAVAVEEGVDGFELGVCQADTDEQRQAGLSVKELFQISHRLRHHVGWRGGEDGLIESAAAGA